MKIRKRCRWLAAQDVAKRRDRDQNCRITPGSEHGRGDELQARIPARRKAAKIDARSAPTEYDDDGAWGIRAVWWVRGTRVPGLALWALRMCTWSTGAFVRALHAEQRYLYCARESHATQSVIVSLHEVAFPGTRAKKKKKETLSKLCIVNFVSACCGFT